MEERVHARSRVEKKVDNEQQYNDIKYDVNTVPDFFAYAEDGSILSANNTMHWNEMNNIYFPTHQQQNVLIEC